MEMSSECSDTYPDKRVAGFEDTHRAEGNVKGSRESRYKQRNAFSCQILDSSQQPPEGVCEALNTLTGSLQNSDKTHCCCLHYDVLDTLLHQSYEANIKGQTPKLKWKL
jgi:hypothetical protein